MSKQSQKPRRTFTPEFKEKIVQLHQHGKKKHEIQKEYDICYSVFNNWIKQAENSGSFKEKDNRTDEENELIKLRKRNQQLEMENDILKQAALILGQK